MGKKSAVKSSAAGNRMPAANDSDWFYRPLVDLREQMNHLFDSLGGGWRVPSIGAPFAARAPQGSSISVHFDVSESEDAIEVSAELPGIDEKDVEVTLANGLLTVQGEKRAESEQMKMDRYVMERRYGAFSRSFRLPDSVEEGKVKAKFDRGVLQIILPKALETKQ